METTHSHSNCLHFNPHSPNNGPISCSHFIVNNTTGAKLKTHPTNAKQLHTHKYTNPLSSSTSQFTMVDICNNLGKPHTSVQIALILTPSRPTIHPSHLCPNQSQSTPLPRKLGKKLTTLHHANWEKIHSITVHFKYLLWCKS